MPVFKIKALKDWSPIVKGMEAEVILKNMSRKPLQNEMQDAFSEKYNIKAPNGVYGNKSSFEIVEM